MARGREHRGSGGEQISPPRFPETIPPLTPSADYTYVLDSVMRMQESMGGLKEAVGELKESVKELKAEQKELGKKVDGIDKKIYAAIVIISLVGFLLTLFGPTISNLISRPTPPPAVQQQPKP